MKALAHRLRGRRNSRRRPDEQDQADHQEDAEAGGPDDRPQPRRSPQGDWRRNRGLNSKTGSCNQLAALAAAPLADVVPPSFANSTESTQLSGHARSASVPADGTRKRVLSRTSSNPQVNGTTAAAAGLRPDDRTTTISSSSSSSHSAGSGRTRSRHGGSMSSNASFMSNHQKPEVAVDVRHQGYLLIKRGLLKVADKRYYFVARHSPELYSCKDETSFSLWLASGHPLDPLGGDAAARGSGLSPVLAGTVLRADAAVEEGNGGGGHHSGRMFSVVVGSASKCFTLKFAAESTAKAAAWLEALQEVQVTKSSGAQHSTKLDSALDKRLLLPLNEQNALRSARADSATASECSASEQGDTVAEVVPHVEEDGVEVVTRSASSSNAKMPRVYAAGRLQSKPQKVEKEEATTPTSHTDSSPTSASTTSEHVEVPPSTPTAPPLTPSSMAAGIQPPAQPRIHRMDSVASCSSTASGQSQSSNNGNVLLFVPVAGSSLTASAARMEKAQQELDALVAKGAKLPSRVTVNHPTGEKIEWRYGVPEYVLTDLVYVKGRQREPETTPLASYVEECCQTFMMEATHKARYEQWQSVCQDTFYLQVNDGERIPGGSILENDMLGLLYLGGMAPEDSDEGQDPRAELAEAFPDGFPMEVLEVFTQPPQCYFSWRHWGPFTGKYRGIKGDGTRVEVRGFGEMMVDASRMRSLRLFFKHKELLSRLQRATDRIAQTRRDAASIAALTPPHIGPGRTMRAASAAVAPVTRKTSAPNAKTNEIIEGLANFTLVAKEQSR